MQLFTATEVASTREQQTAAEIKRLETVSKELLLKRKDLKDLEADFEYSLKTQQEQWAKEQAEHNQKIHDLKLEVARLEERRKQNLFPLEEKAENLDNIAKELEKKTLKLNKKEEELSERAEALKDRLTEVGDREIQADRLGKLQKIAQEGIDTQKRQITEQAKNLSKNIEDSLRDITIAKQDISRKESAMALREEQLLAIEKSQKKREEDFIKRELLLQDRFALLERTQKELNDKRSTR